MFSEFVEIPRWAMPDGSFVVMNPEFALARQHTIVEAYRNTYKSLGVNVTRVKPCEDYGVDCENGCETANDCIFCPLCNQEHGNHTDDGSCGNCGEVGIIDV